MSRVWCWQCNGAVETVPKPEGQWVFKVCPTCGFIFGAERRNVLKIYLTARYSRRMELNFYAQQLRAMGFTVTSRWLASWAMSLKRPSDLGYPDDGYNECNTESPHVHDGCWRVDALTPPDMRSV